jgi:hypothetical protein
MGMTRKNGGRQQGAQEHGEGRHGKKTQKHIADAWNHAGGVSGGGKGAGNMGTSADQIGPRYDPDEIRAHAPPSNNHIFSGRTQHDDADLNSEKTRLARDAERHGHISHTEWAERSARASAKRKS